MNDREVILIGDSDSEDDIQVISDNHRREIPNQRNRNVRFNEEVNIMNNRQTSSNTSGNNVQEVNDDNNDDVEIVGETINVPERQELSPGFVIHAPNGPIPIYDHDSSTEPERRSFQNARGPVEPSHFRSPQEISRIAEERRLLDRMEHQRRMREIESRQRLVEETDAAQLRNDPSFINSRRGPLPRSSRSTRAARGRSTQRRGAGMGSRFGARGNTVGDDRAHLWHMMLMGGAFPAMQFNNLFFNDEDDEDNDPPYYPGMAFPRGGPVTQNGGVDQHIMNIIQQREDQEADKKRMVNENATNILQKQCHEHAKSIKAPFTATIDPEEDYVCILCGVTLGEGIPSDFRGNVSKTQLPVLQEQNDVPAPYQALNLITDVDRDLSKRIFMSTCGHTYCGRCVKNISSVRGTLRSKSKLKFKKNDNDIENPFIYAPLKCIGPNCGVGLGAKKRFNEIFV